MAKYYRTVFDVDISPDTIIDVCKDIRLCTSYWKFVESVDTSTNPPKVRFKFKKFGITASYEYPVTVEVRDRTIEYRGEEKGRRFGVRIEAASLPAGGSRVIVEAYYEGPFENLSGGPLKEFVGGIVEGIKSLASRKPKEPEKRGDKPSKLLDVTYIINVISNGKLLARKTVHVKDAAEVQKILREIIELSRGRQVFARLFTRQVYVRLLAENGSVVELVIEDNNRTIVGVEHMDKLMDLLVGGEVDVIILEVP